MTATARFWLLVSEEDVTDAILRDVEECVDGWFLDERLSTEEFIDKLCGVYGASRDYATDEFVGWDIDNYMTPAVKKIMRHARAYKREATT